MNFTVSDGFPYYIQLVASLNTDQLFHDETNFQLLSSLTEDQMNFRYAPDKWRIKQIVGHMADHERIMTYRALRISRNDTTPQPGYDQELLVKNSRFHEMSQKDLIDDYKNVRKATLSLIHSFSDEQLQHKGPVWKFELTVADILKATIGHEYHHMKVINEKYLKQKR